MEGVRLIQCYSCFTWCKHLRPDCPTKHDPQICSNCSQTGHSYTECQNELRCINCEGSHPATARICPEYTKALEHQKTKIAEQLAHLILPLLYLCIFGPDFVNTFKTAFLDSENPYDFLNLLFQSFKTIFKPDIPSHYSNSSFSTTDQNENNCITDPNETSDKDESSLPTSNNFNSIIELATQTSKISLPKVIPQAQITILDDNSKNPTEFGFTKNGIETLGEFKYDTNLELCGLVKEDKKICSTLIYINTEKGNENIHLQINDVEPPELIAISPSHIENITIKNHNIILNLKEKCVHLKIYKNWDGNPGTTRYYDSDSALSLTKWIHEQFNTVIKLET